MIRLLMRSRRRYLLLWAVALSAAYGAPRLVAYRGLEQAAPLEFLDMNRHLRNLDVVEKLGRLDPSAWDDPFFKSFPELYKPHSPVKWPHGVYWAASPWARLFGPASIWTVQLTNLCFSLILVAGIIGLGAAAGSVSAGLWASLLTLLLPPMVAGTHYLNLDYPLAAMVAMGLLILFHSDHFRRRNPTLALGLWSGLGLAVKLTYAIYLFVPSMVSLFLGLRGARGCAGKGLTVVRALAGAVIALLVGWALVQFPLMDLARVLSVHLQAAFPETGEKAQQVIQPLTLRWFLAVPLILINEGSWCLAILLGAGLILVHGRRGNITGRWLLLSSFWGTYLGLTLMGNKMARYLLPLYPILALCGVLGLQAVCPPRWLRAALAATVALFGLVLGLTHEQPTRWLLDQRSREQDRYMYDLLLPSRQELQGLRVLRHHPYCQFEELFASTQGLLSKVAGHVPLTVHLADDPDLGKDHQRNYTTHYLDEVFRSLTVHLSQTNRDRVLFAPRSIPVEVAAGSSLLLVVYYLSLEPPLRLVKDLILVGREAVEINCRGGKHPIIVTISLYRQPKPGQDP